MCMAVLPACLSEYYMYASCSWRPEKGVQSPGTGHDNGWEPLCGH